MARGDHGIAGKGENLLPIVAKLLRKVGGASTNRGGEEGIADHGQRPAQPSDEEGRLARSMTGGEQGFDVEFTDVEMHALVEGAGSGMIHRRVMVGPDFGLWRGLGEPLSGRLNPPDGAKFAGVMAGPPEILHIEEV